MTILAEDSILDVWQGSQYANEHGCKKLAKWLLMSTEKHQNKEVYWYEKGYVLSAIVKNKFYVFLASTLNSLCFIGNALSVTSNSRHQRRIKNPVKDLS